MEDGQYVVWSPLSTKEYIKMTEVAVRSNSVGLFELEEHVLAKCIKFTSYSIPDEDWDAWGIETKEQASAMALEIIPAGVMSTLRKVIVEMSAPPRTWDDLMTRAGNKTALIQPYEAAIAKICMTFPAYTVAELEEMESEEIVRLFALAMMAAGTPCEPEKSQAQTMQEDIEAILSA